MLFLYIGCGPAASCLLDVTVRNQIGQGALYGRQADIGAGLGDFFFGDLPGSALDDGLDALGFGHFAVTEVFHTVFELVIGLDHDTEHIFEEGQVVISVIVPVLGAGLQGLVVRILALLDKHLNTDILANDESGTVQEQECKEAAHTAVSVIERMDTQEVQNEHRHQEERIVCAGFDSLVVSGTEVQHSIRSLESRDRTEADSLRSICVLFRDDIVGVLVNAARGAAAEGIEIPVQLEDVIGARGYVLIGFVDGGQYVSVAGNLFLIAIARLDLFLDDRFQAFVRRIDTLNTVGSVGTLNLGHFQQGGKNVRLRFDEEFLATPAFVQAGQNGNYLRSEEIFRAVYEIKFVHSAFGLQGKYSVFLPQKRIICIKFEKMMQKTTRMRQIT